MNERDFDKLFQDKIGDELPFDFQPADWQKVSRALDEVLPNTPIATPELAALTSVKKVWWWAAAAATVLVASNLWLIYQLRETKREVTALQTQKANEVVDKQKTQIVIVRDTIYQTIYSNAPHLAQTPTMANQKFLDTKISKKNEINTYKNDNQLFMKDNLTNLSKNTSSKIIGKPTADPNKEYLGAQGSDNRATPPPPQYVQTEVPQPDFEQTTGVATQPTYATVAEKYATISKNAKQAGSANIPNMSEDNILVNKDLDILEINRLKKLAYHSKNLPLYELEDYITKTPISPLLKSHIPIISGWTIGGHKTWLFDQPAYRKAPKTEGNIGATIGADLGRDWRISASFDYWRESQQRIDSADRQSVPEPPASDYRFEFMEIESPLVQVRVGVDYYLPQFGSNNFFIGAGFAKQWLTNPEEKYVFKHRPLQPNPNPQQPQFKDIEQQGSDKNIRDFALLRLGTEGSLYRGLGWNANVSSQWAIKDFSDQTWSVQIGLHYRF